MRKGIDLYKNYGKYTNINKMLPSIVDGLLPVHRRMIYVLHTIASKSKVKTVTALGELNGKYHPHATSKGPAVWAVSNDFAVGYGQWGSKIGIDAIDAASERYTSIKASPEIEEIALKYVNFAEWYENDVGFEEPRHLPTLFPFCLMGKEELSQIGFGTKPEFPIYTKIDLCKRLLFLLGKTQKSPSIKPFIPNCEILSSASDIKTLITTGEVTLTIKGSYVEDAKNNIIYIKGWHPREKFESIFNNIVKYVSKDKENGNLFESNGVVIIDESTVDSGTKIRFEVSRQRNVKDAYNLLKNSIDKALTQNIRYAMYVVDDGKFKIASVDEMLIRCYKHFKETYEKFCIHTINKTKNQIIEYSNISKIKPHISNINTKKSVDDSIKELSKLSGVSDSDIKVIIEKYNIKKLLSFNTDKSDLEIKLKEFEDKLNNLEVSVLKEYQLAVTK